MNIIKMQKYFLIEVSRKLSAESAGNTIFRTYDLDIVVAYNRKTVL